MPLIASPIALKLGQFFNWPIDDVEVRYSGWQCFVFNVFRQYAVTWNGVIYITPYGEMQTTKSAEELFAHELVHVKQQRDMGWWRFLWAYIDQWFEAATHRRPVSDMPLEMEAYEKSWGVRDALQQGG